MTTAADGEIFLRNIGCGDAVNISVRVIAAIHGRADNGRGNLDPEPTTLLLTEFCFQPRRLDSRIRSATVTLGFPEETIAISNLAPSGTIHANVGVVQHNTERCIKYFPSPADRYIIRAHYAS